MIKRIKTWYIKRITDRLERHFTRNFSRIADDQFIPGQMRYNFQCHLNSAHEASITPGLRTILVYAVDSRNQGFCLHVINQTSEGKFVDHTWGFEYQYHSYFLIKEILPDQRYRMQAFFDDHRRDYIKMFSRNWLVRLLGIQPIDVF